MTKKSHSKDTQPIDDFVNPNPDEPEPNKASLQISLPKKQEIHRLGPKAGAKLTQDDPILEYLQQPEIDISETHELPEPLNKSELSGIETEAESTLPTPQITKTGTYDVFISYSRKDKPFVQKLYETMLADNRLVWVDWGNIPVTADWRAEIKDGIEKSNAVTFVLSPDFLASKECQAELEIAEAYNKRLIPIVHRDVDNQDTPPSLGALNWIFFRRGDNFDESFQTLEKAIDTDLNWVREHTRLLIRATEWENENRKKGLLLRSDTLTKAEQLVAQADKNPAPTPLQKQFILAGRENAVKQQRFRMILVSSGLVMSLIFAVLSFIQFRVARDGRNEALSQKLGAEAIIFSEVQPDLAALLSVAADQIAALSGLPISGLQTNILSNLRHSPYLITTLHGHTANVRSVAFSPDGTMLASGGKDKSVILWDRATHQPLGEPLTGHTDRVTQVAFHPHSPILASSSRDTTIRLWDIASQEPIGEPLTGHTERVNSIAFNPDGTVLASGSADNTIILWNIANARESSTPIGEPLTGHTDDIHSLTLSPDGKILASGGKDNTIRMWNMETGRLLYAPIEGHTGSVNSLAFSPDGKILASASTDRTIRLWDVETGRPYGTPFTGHPTIITSIAFSPDGELLASGSEDNTVILWDAKTSQQLGWPLKGHANSVLGLAFSPDGKTLATASSDSSIVLWDIEAARHLAGHTGVVRSVAYSPDGQLIASGSGDRTIRLWDAVTLEAIDTFLSNPSGNTNSLKSGHTDTIWSIDFSPDGQTIASGSADDTIILWDVASGSPSTEPIPAHEGDVLSVTYSPDGQTLASGSKDHTIKLWKATTMDLLLTLKGHTGGVNDVAFGPNGRLMASAGRDNLVMVWDVATGHPVGPPLTGHTDDVNSVVFSPDGKLLASGSHDTSIILWDVDMGKEVAELEGHIYRVTSVAFSPDGKTLASGSYDTNVVLWDPDTRQPIGPPLIGHTNDVNSITWSPNGETLVSGGWDNMLIVWNAGFSPWSERACRVANRNLSQKEWEEFVGPFHPYRTQCEE